MQIVSEHRKFLHQTNFYYETQFQVIDWASATGVECFFSSIILCVQHRRLH